MKSLVIYSTQSGSTEQIAHAVSTVFRQHCPGDMMPASQVQPYHFSDISLLAVGSPRQECSMAEDVRELLTSVPDGALRGAVALAFETREHRPPGFAG
jgi:menaquinone-dependent protoporphyrinogen IX oxidase